MQKFQGIEPRIACFFCQAYFPLTQDTNLILHSVDIRNDVRAIKEWHEGYEELKAIPHSFALEFKDRNKDTWSLYADSEADKVTTILIFVISRSQILPA